MEQDNINQREYWNDIWDGADVDTFATYPKKFRSISLAVGSGKTVLDVAGGVGILADIIQRKGNQVFNIDISDLALKKSKELNPKVNVMVSDVPPIPFENDAFDVVIATEIVEHYKEPEKLIEELKRVSNKRVIISVPDYSAEKDGNLHHYTLFTKDSFKQMLDKYFVRVEIEEHFEIFYNKKCAIKHACYIAVCEKYAEKI
jgi:ubiquinone/menaquinone biosynthesis C-methylase UbiE